MFRQLAASVFFLAVLSATTFAQENPAETTETQSPGAQPSPGQTPAITSHEVKAGPFRVDVQIDGVFVAETMTEIAVVPKEWTDFSVVEAVPHGSVIHKGKVLVRFDETELADSIADMEAEQRLAELSIIQSERALPQLERSLTLAHESAQREAQHAAEDLQRFAEIDRPFAEKSAEFRLKSVKNYLEYAQEELDQLEKMYKADDLTEESEEIVLKRQRDAVESARFSVERQEIAREETLNVEIPREEASFKHQVEQTKLALDQAQIALDLNVNEKRFELEKAKHTRTRSLEKHAKLLADRGLMQIEAPTDGVVYYGRCENGKWPQVEAMSKSLRPLGKISPKTVFMTIVSPKPMKVVGQVAESDLAGFSAGLAARIEPTANASASLNGRVALLSTVPVEDGKFGVELSLGPSGSPDWVVPGMTCSVTVTTYERATALTVPAEALRTDEADPTAKYVYVLGEDDKKPRRQSVRVGKQSGDRVEILEGIEAGDHVALGDVEA